MPWCKILPTAEESRMKSLREVEALEFCRANPLGVIARRITDGQDRIEDLELLSGNLVAERREVLDYLGADPRADLLSSVKKVNRRRSYY
jgi:hypothetical protein